MSHKRSTTYRCEDDHYGLLYVFDVMFSGTAGTPHGLLEPGDPPEVEIERLELVSCRPYDGKVAGAEIELPEAMQKIIENWAYENVSDEIEEKCLEIISSHDYYED
jgi:hypothetical protein